MILTKKPGLVTKHEKRNNTKLKESENDVLPVNHYVIVIFSVYGKFGAIVKLDSGRIVCKLTFSLIATFYLTKTENRTKKSLAQSSH